MYLIVSLYLFKKKTVVTDVTSHHLKRASPKKAKVAWPPCHQWASRVGVTGTANETWRVTRGYDGGFMLDSWWILLDGQSSAKTIYIYLFITLLNMVVWDITKIRFSRGEHDFVGFHGGFPTLATYQLITAHLPRQVQGQGWQHVRPESSSLKVLVSS